MDSRQGGHHVPQKSKSTTFPRSAALERRSPSKETKEKSGTNGSRPLMNPKRQSQDASPFVNAAPAEESAALTYALRQRWKRFEVYWRVPGDRK